MNSAATTQGALLWCYTIKKEEGLRKKTDRGVSGTEAIEFPLRYLIGLPSFTPNPCRTTQTLLCYPRSLDVFIAVVTRTRLRYSSIKVSSTEPRIIRYTREIK